MDTRRLSTADILSMGIIDQPVPDTDLPKDVEWLRADEDAEFADIALDDIEQALKEGKFIKAPEYYGIPNVWREGDRFRGLLLQYRNVTEDHTFTTAKEAAEWFRDTYWAVCG